MSLLPGPQAWNWLKIQHAGWGKKARGLFRCTHSWERAVPSLGLFPQDCFGNVGILWFCIYFRIICHSSLKNVMGILIGVALNLYIALSNKAILKRLIFPIQEHGIYLHLFVTFNFFYQCLILWVYKSFTSVVKFILRYFIIFAIITFFSFSFFSLFLSSLIVISTEKNNISVYSLCIFQIYWIYAIWWNL